MSLTENFKGQSEQLTNFSEVELIYYTVNKNEDNITHICYTVVCNLDNVISNTKLLKTIIATREVIKTLYSHTDVSTGFKIVSLKEFEENLIDNNSDFDNNELKNAHIIYSDNEFLTSVIEKNQTSRTR